MLVIAVDSCAQVFVYSKRYFFGRAFLKATYFIEKGRDIMDVNSNIRLHRGRGKRY
jgi:hypothetical protein